MLQYGQLCPDEKGRATLIFSYLAQFNTMGSSFLPSLVYFLGLFTFTLVSIQFIGRMGMKGKMQCFKLPESTCPREGESMSKGGRGPCPC